MTTHLGLQRILLPTAQVSSLTTGSITLPSARGAFSPPYYYESIATYEVPATPDSYVEFTSIPSTYKHLQVRCLLKGSRSNGNDGFSIRLNGDSGANYNANYTRIVAPNTLNSGQSINSSAFSTGEMIGTYSNANNIFSPYVITFYDYANTTKYKSGWSLGGHDQGGTVGPNNDTDLVNYFESTWMSTSAIHTIRFLPSNATFQQYSRFSLYGIRGS